MVTIDSHQWDSLDFKTQIGPLLFNIYLGPLRYDYTHVSNTYAQTRHDHSLYEVHLVIRGTGTISVNNSTYNLSPNTLCIIAPGKYHVVKPDYSSETKLANFKFNYYEVKKYPEFLHESQEKEIVHIKKTLAEIDHCFICNAKHIMDLIEQIYSEINTKSIGYYSKIQSLLSQTIIDILRLVSPEVKDNYIIPERSDDDRRSSLIEGFFDKNYAIPGITIEHLAEYLNLSARQTSRIIKSLYNASFNEKLTEIRIEVAKDMLLNTDLSIEQISEKSGYSSPTYFHKVFKEVTGMTPQNYRVSGGHSVQSSK
ncbi:MAG TPA: AraC family transcriptional regulator [Clostridiaceae bacterium]|nr:AraC family transcriptional regulator [Clostridiaceae bacterium]